MSYANGTLNYNLPQTVGTDKRDWSDTNQAFSDVDAALKAAADGASQAAEDITALTLRVGTAEDDISGLKAEDISLDGRLDTAEGAISTLQLQVPDVRGDLEDMITAFNEATATSTHAYSVDDYFIYNDVLYKATTSISIGDTIVPNTNCEATNITTEINDVKSALDKGGVQTVTIQGETWETCLNRLHDLVDWSKVSDSSTLNHSMRWAGGKKFVGSSSNENIQRIELASSGSLYVSTNFTNGVAPAIANVSADTIGSSGVVMRVYY